MSHHCYFDGQFHPLDTPLVKTNDLGLLRGYGMFDYLRTYNGIPFRFEHYWDRFSRSAASLGMEIPVDFDQAGEILTRLYRLSGEAEVSYRLVLTGGYADDGLTVTAPNFFVRSEPLPAENPEGRKRGIKVIPYDYVRDLPYIKTTSYVHMMMMASECRRQGAADLLYHKDGLVSELTRSNLFIVKGRTLLTPDRNALRGITRNLVIEQATEILDIEQRDITLSELLLADEVFTTSTTKWITPIVQVGDERIGNGIPGAYSLQLQSKIEEVFREYGRA
jgi:branched-chain amino acid aminotransferase